MDFSLKSTILSYLILTHATYTMKPNTMQLMQHNTQLISNTCNAQPMPPIPPMQFYG